MEIWRLGCLLLVAALLFTICKITYALCFSPLRHVPGPALAKITSLWVRFHDIRLQRNHKIYEWHQKYGDIIVIAPGQVSVSSLSCSREIYSISGRHPKSSYFDHFSAYGRRCIFTTRDCREHQMMRKRTFQFYQPKFIYRPAIVQSIRALAKTTLDHICEPIGAFQKQATVNILTMCNRFAFDNSTRLALGDYGSRVINRNPDESWMLDGWEETELWDNMAKNLPLVYSLMRTVYRKYTGNVEFCSNDEQLQKWTTQQLDSAFAKPDEINNESLLGWLLEFKTSDGEKLPNSEIAEEIIDNILAAQATVTLALTYALWDLASDPSWQSKLRTELRSLPTDDHGFPTIESLMAAPTLDSCVRESSRIHPLSSGHAERIVPIKKAYDGVMLPSGVTISASTLSLHHNPTAFPDPYTYTPARWLSASESHRAFMEKHYMPFGYGARFCLGATFALIQIKTLMAFTILRLELAPDPLSGTDKGSMDQLDTQNALPKGLRCDVRVREVEVLEK